jgi:protein gp37
MTVGPQFAEAMIGDLVRQAEISVAHLRRIAREPNSSAMERAMAESFAWKVHRELFEKLQSVGYLPRVPQGIVAEVYQHMEADPIAGYEQLAEQIEELERVSRLTGQEDLPHRDQVQRLLDEVQRGRLSVQIERLKTGVAVPVTPGDPCDGGDRTPTA